MKQTLLYNLNNYEIDFIITDMSVISQKLSKIMNVCAYKIKMEQNFSSVRLAVGKDKSR